MNLVVYVRCRTLDDVSISSNVIVSTKAKRTTLSIAANVAGRNSIKRINNTISDYLYSSSALHANATPDSTASTLAGIVKADTANKNELKFKTYVKKQNH